MVNNKKVYFLIPQVLVALVTIVLGNIFWFNFSQTINETHLLTNSAITIVSTITFPIMIFSVYLSFCALLSIVIPNKQVQLLILVLSLVDYVMVTGVDYKNLIGEVAICAGLFIFLINFQSRVTLVNSKSALFNRVSSAFSITSIIISVILAINFYSLYTKSLASDNVLVTNGIMRQILKPIIYIYLDDLKIQDLNESFTHYQVRMSKLTHQDISVIRSITLSKLSITQANDTEPMQSLIKKSFDNSILKLAHNYGKTIPLVISLGLGVIVQTLLSISSLIANFTTAGLIILCKKLNLIDTVKIDYQVEKEVYQG